MATAVRHFSKGDHVKHTPVAALAAGDVVDLGDFVGIAEVPIAAGVEGNLAIEGVFTVTKKTGETWAVGETAYWDVGTTSFSHTSSYSEAVAGLIMAAAVSGAATGEVKLIPGVVRT